jgi:hypothetical protein
MMHSDDAPLHRARWLLRLPWLLPLLLVLLLAGAAGCAHGRRTLTLDPSPQANGGRPFYILVRAVNEKAFFGESYQTVAQSLFPQTNDPSVRLVRLLWPGRQETARVTIADSDSFAVYAFFTQPGDPWRLLLSPPLRKDYALVLGTGTISLRVPGTSPASAAATATAAEGIPVPPGITQPVALPKADPPKLPELGGPKAPAVPALPAAPAAPAAPALPPAPTVPRL